MLVEREVISELAAQIWPQIEPELEPERGAELEPQLGAEVTRGALSPSARVTILVIDTKWNNDGAVLNHPSLRGLRRVRLARPPSYSRIWRCNARAVSGCVSTIEAIYCLVRELELERQQRPALGQQRPEPAAGPAAGSGYDGRYDGLLLLFGLTRHRIGAETAARAETTGEAGLAPYEAARKAAALARRSQKQ